MTTGAQRSTRLLALGGIAGPGAFIAAWSVLGAVRDGYSPVHDAISRLAELGAGTRPAMTAGFVAFGLAVPAYGVALRRSLPGPAWTAAVATGVATLGVAACPLGGSDAIEQAHGAFAGAAYVALAALPIAAAAQLRAQGRHSAARWSVLCGAAAGACLAATTAGTAHGMWQRAGLTVGDVWLVLSALRMVRTGRL